MGLKKMAIVREFYREILNDEPDEIIKDSYHLDLLKTHITDMPEEVQRICDEAFIGRLPLLAQTPGGFCVTGMDFPLIFIQDSLERMIHYNCMLIDLIDYENAFNKVIPYTPPIDEISLVKEARLRLGYCYFVNSLPFNALIKEMSTKRKNHMTEYFLDGLFGKLHSNRFFDAHIKHVMYLQPKRVLAYRINIQLLFVLLHEIGHILLHHEENGKHSIFRAYSDQETQFKGSIFAKQKEFEADLFAFNIMLKQPDIDEKYVAEFFLLASYLDCIVGENETHPPAKERLKRLLKEYDSQKHYFKKQYCDMIMAKMDVAFKDPDMNLGTILKDLDRKFRGYDIMMTALEDIADGKNWKQRHEDQ